MPSASKFDPDIQDQASDQDMSQDEEEIAINDDEFKKLLPMKSCLNF